MPNISIRAGRAVAAVALPAALVALGACSLDVLTPNVVPVSATQGESALTARLNGALTDFAVALSGFNNGNNGEGIALLSGLFADEYVAADQFDTHKQVDTRNVQPDNGSNAGVLRSLYRALSGAQASADAYVAANQGASAGRATALNRVGFSFTILAETYCSGLPFSRVDAGGNLIPGTSITTQQMLDSAVTKFTDAATAAQAAHATSEYYAAIVGRARALLDKDTTATGSIVAAASASLALVPTDFVYATEQSSSADVVKSGNYVLTFLSTRFTTADFEGGNGVGFVSAADPRLQIDSSLGVSTFDFTTPLYAPVKYNDYASPTVIASGVEARLIEAEIALRAGNYGTTLSILNSMRPPSSQLAPATTSAARVKQLFDERAIALFGTAHRLGDLRRLIRAPYKLPVNTVFPTGRNAKSQAYGSQVSLRVSQAETSNPNYNTAACDPTAK